MCQGMDRGIQPRLAHRPVMIDHRYLVSCNLNIELDEVSTIIQCTLER